MTLAETALARCSRSEDATPAGGAARPPTAYALATVHNASGCATAISKARTQVDHLEPDHDLPWLYWVSPAWILAEAGDSLLRLGQADRAAAMINEGITSFDESFARDRQIYSVHLV